MADPDPRPASHPALADLAWPVRTERLEIRPMTLADLDAVWAYRRLPEVTRWIGSATTDREEFAATWSRPERLASQLALVHDGHLVGDLMVEVGDAWSQRECAERARGTQAMLGWTVSPSYGGRGLGTEAVRAVLGVCFDGLGVRRVLAECFALNEPSWRLMERVGMRREQHAVQDSLHRELGWIDGYTYALLAPEWRA